MEAEFLKPGIESPILGPNYFVGRKMAADFMEKFKIEEFKPLVDEFAEKFRDKVWDSFLEYLLSDTESNLHSSIWRRLDICIEALLTGEHWAMNKYCLLDKYGTGENIRKAIAKHIPKEITDARIADLESQVEGLKKSIEYMRRTM